MNCPKCNTHKLYTLENGYKKCSHCHHKFSLKKYDNYLKIIGCFCSNINALEASKKLGVNYRTVSNKYAFFRQFIASYLENEYYSKPNDNSSYEEFYFFTQRQKEKKYKSLYEGINLIGFYSNQKVYTLLMPPLRKYSQISDEKSFEHYLNWNKLQSQHAYKTPLKVFFSFLEQNLKKYRGLNHKNFFYYLKECEFKYNYLLNEQIDILKNAYGSHI